MFVRRKVQVGCHHLPTVLAPGRRVALTSIRSFAVPCTMTVRFSPGLGGSGLSLIESIVLIVSCLPPNHRSTRAKASDAPPYSHRVRGET